MPRNDVAVHSTDEDQSPEARSIERLIAVSRDGEVYEVMRTCAFDFAPRIVTRHYQGIYHI